MINFSESYKVIPTNKPKFTPLEEKEQNNINKLKTSRIAISKEFCDSLPSLKNRKIKKYNHYNYSKIVDNNVYEEERNKYENAKFNINKVKNSSEKFNVTNNNFDKNWRETQHNIYFNKISNSLNKQNNKNNQFHKYNYEESVNLNLDIVNTEDSIKSKFIEDDYNSKKTKNSNFTFNVN